MDVEAAREELRQIRTRREAMLAERSAVSAELERLFPLARAAGIGNPEIAQLTGLTRAGVHKVLNRRR